VCVFGASLNASSNEVTLTGSDGSPQPLPCSGDTIRYEISLNCLTIIGGSPPVAWQVRIVYCGDASTTATITLQGGGPHSPNGATGTGTAASGGETVGASIG
jgi:hypothetical protein